jgi:hypothetical protein
MRERYPDRAQGLSSDAAVPSPASLGTISDEDAYLLRLGQESIRELMDVTLGRPEAYTAGTALQVLERARDNIQRELKAELSRERKEREGAEQRLERRDAAIDQRAERIGRRAAQGTFVVALLLLVVGLIFGPVGLVADAWSPLPTAFQWVCTGALIGFTILGFVDERISVRRIAARVAQFVEKRAAAVLRRLTDA